MVRETSPTRPTKRNRPLPIAKGEEWGHPGELPAQAPVAATDGEAAQLVGQDAGPIGLSGGDLARTLGIRAPYDRSTPKHLVPVDAVHIELDDGSRYVSIAHVVLGDLRRNRSTAAIMNAAFIGTRNIAPRAHPGDGKVDVVQMDLDVGDRMKAWKRMTTGTHVPHPAIVVRKRSEGIVEVTRPRQVRVDGHLVGRSAGVRYYVIPAAIVVAVS